MMRKRGIFPMVLVRCSSDVLFPDPELIFPVSDRCCRVELYPRGFTAGSARFCQFLSVNSPCFEVRTVLNPTIIPMVLHIPAQTGE